MTKGGSSSASVPTVPLRSCPLSSDRPRGLVHRDRGASGGLRPLPGSQAGQAGPHSQCPR